MCCVLSAISKPDSDCQRGRVGITRTVPVTKTASPLLVQGNRYGAAIDQTTNQVWTNKSLFPVVVIGIQLHAASSHPTSVSVIGSQSNIQSQQTVITYPTTVTVPYKLLLPGDSLTIENTSTDVGITYIQCKNIDDAVAILRGSP